MAQHSTRTARPADDDSLTPKEGLFVVAYAAHLNAARAAREAGYSVKTAKTIGAELLTRPRVLSAINDIVEARKAQFTHSEARVLEEASCVAFSTVQALMDEDGQLIPVHKLSPVAAASISSIEVGFTSSRRGRKGQTRTRERVIKIKLWDKPRALELLAKYYGIGNDGTAAPIGPSIIFPPGTRIAIE